MSATPETDAACWMQEWEGYRGEIINSNFARHTLESLLALAATNEGWQPHPIFQVCQTAKRRCQSNPANH